MFGGKRNLPYMKAGIRNFIAKRWRDSELKVRAGCGMSKITLGITGLREIRLEIKNRPFFFRNMVENLKVICF